MYYYALWTYTEAAAHWPRNRYTYSPYHPAFSLEEYSPVRKSPVIVPHAQYTAPFEYPSSFQYNNRNSTNTILSPYPPPTDDAVTSASRWLDSHQDKYHRFIGFAGGRYLVSFGQVGTSTTRWWNLEKNFPTFFLLISRYSDLYKTQKHFFKVLYPTNLNTSFGCVIFSSAKYFF